MDGNPNFPNPPFKLSDFKAALDAFASASAETLHNGGRKAFAEKKKQRTNVIKLMRHLGHYVEVESDGEVAKLVSSGFEVSATSASGPADACPQPEILKVRQGPLGELLVSFSALYREAVRYELRHAAHDADGKPGVWTSRLLTKARPAVRIGNLTPGTVYAFQVRALGKNGNHADWSNCVTRMCI